jgi:hypothetical protein
VVVWRPCSTESPDLKTIRGLHPRWGGGEELADGIDPHDAEDLDVGPAAIDKINTEVIDLAELLWGGS